MYLLGFDLGSSSVKTSLMETASGGLVASAYYPATEMAISSPKPGFAEQNPEDWWKNACVASKAILKKTGINPAEVKAIGISYQMHGLVVVDDNLKPLRPSIIWCDSRAVEIGNKALEDLGPALVLPRLLNSPGNFTASKLAWVMQNEPGIFAKVKKFMLPGDYLAARMTGEIFTTPSGISEKILWDFLDEQPAGLMLDYFNFDESLLPLVVPTFGEQGKLTSSSAEELGLATGTPVTYRAGDQPNNAFSLNVMEPGEVAATGGTSGVVYGITDRLQYDERSRVNTFLHVNHSLSKNRYGTLMCVNGSGSLNSWVKNVVLGNQKSYDEINKTAATAPIGAEGIVCLPFGNGAERILENRELGGSIQFLDFNRHSMPTLLRSVQEGVAFALYYGMEIMHGMNLSSNVIRAGEANMFLSPLFRQTLANVANIEVELFNTDGAHGAARGAGVGLGIYNSRDEIFVGLKAVKTIEPEAKGVREQVSEAYEKWKDTLNAILESNLAKHQ